MTRRANLERRIFRLLLLFWVGLIAMAIGAFPIEGELRWITGQMGVGAGVQPSDLHGIVGWLVTLRDAVHATNSSFSFLPYYGSDWVAFSLFMMAFALVGPLRDPIRNRWVVTSLLVGCIAVIPMVMVAGAIRGIPIWWRMIDGLFGAVGALILWPCARAIRELERVRASTR